MKNKKFLLGKGFLISLFLIVFFIFPLFSKSQSLPDFDPSIKIKLGKTTYEAGEEIKFGIGLKNDDENHPLAGGRIYIEVIEGLGEYGSEKEGNLIKNLCLEERVYLKPLEERSFIVNLPSLSSGQYRLAVYFLSNKYVPLSNTYEVFAVKGEENKYIKNIKILRDSLKIKESLGGKFNWGVQDPKKEFKVSGLIENKGGEEKVVISLKIKGWHQCQPDIFFKTEKEITLKPESTTPFDFVLNAPEKPTAYSIEIELSKENEVISRGYARIVSRGISGRIIDVSLNNYKFEKDEKVRVESSVVGAVSGDREIEAQLEMKIFDKKGIIFSEIRDVLLAKNETRKEIFEFESPRKIQNFAINALLKDKEGKELDFFEENYILENFREKTTQELEEEERMKEETKDRERVRKEKSSSSNFQIFFIFLIILLIISILIIWKIFQKQKK